jgi:glycogen phosphorylase
MALEKVNAILQTTAESGNNVNGSNPIVAFLTPEVCLPTQLTKDQNLSIYSGGLGVLAGDQGLAASDLGMNFTGVSLLYTYGYFEQGIDQATGEQIEKYPRVIPKDALPQDFGLNPVKDWKGNILKLVIPVADRDVYFTAYQVHNWLLLSTDLDENGREDDPARLITGHLYGGDLTTRLRQEMILGIGGHKVLNALGFLPEVYHLNDAHPAQVNKSRIEAILEGKAVTKDSIAKSKDEVASNTLMTWHTLRPAAMDTFPLEMLRTHFSRNGIGIVEGIVDFLDSQNPDKKDSEKGLSMFELARATSAEKNAVSIRQAVEIKSRWGEDVTPITNGVHIRWMNERAKQFVDPDQERFVQNHTNPEYVKNQLEERSTEEIREFRNNQRRDLVEFVNHQVGAQILDPNKLTLGFARRAADYKRIWLLFHDPERFAQILSNSEKPVQMVLAGKAHPKDGPSRERIREINAIVKWNDILKRSVVFIPNYDQLIAAMVTNADIWVNNPEEGEEASGTSPMKAGMKGAINWSTFDGCMYEVPDEHFFRVEDDKNPDIVAKRMYDMLEYRIAPEFYENGRAVSGVWSQKVLGSMGFFIPYFSATRMEQRYNREFYIPLSTRAVSPKTY